MSLTIGMLLFPDLTQLDYTGPYEVFHRLPGARVHHVWKRIEPIRAEGGLHLLADTTLSACPPLDVLFVPGGFGQITLMEDDQVLAFLADQGARAQWITSVCTGSLALGAAGLLQGRRATSHWSCVDLLSAYGAIPTEERVVVDGNRITGGGVTSGIDFSLVLADRVAGEDAARRIALAIEYDPEPPFRGGHPRVAHPDTVHAMREALEARRATRVAQAERARAMPKGA